MTRAHQFTKPIRKQTMAEQVAVAIKDSILNGDLGEGDALPTEPALCDQFGVSRAVIRDATRILLAQGLVDAKQGSGVYVTPPVNHAFGDALLLSLQRMSATAWDVEEFEQTLLPHVVALAAINATEDDLTIIQQQLTDYLAYHADHARKWRQFPSDELPQSAVAELAAQYGALSLAIFEATHNQILILLAKPLTQLHGMRFWTGAEITDEQIIANEQRIMGEIVDAIVRRDPQRARAAVEAIQNLPQEAIHAMRDTHIGEMIRIELPSTDSGTAGEAGS